MMYAHPVFGGVFFLSSEPPLSPCLTKTFKATPHNPRLTPLHVICRVKPA